MWSFYFIYITSITRGVSALLMELCSFHHFYFKYSVLLLFSLFLESQEPQHYKQSKKKRDKGQSYWSPYDKKRKVPRTLKQRCNCKSKLQCNDVPDEVREKLFADYWAIGSLQTQSEFIFRHVETSETSWKTAGSRQKLSKRYFLHISKDKRVRVCQTMFLNTLGKVKRPQEQQ